MMNRDVMARQMFAKGGAAFPDLSGDGKVTQKDILMGRGVLPMAEGGDVPGDVRAIFQGLVDAMRGSKSDVAAYVRNNSRDLSDIAQMYPNMAAMINEGFKVTSEVPMQEYFPPGYGESPESLPPMQPETDTSREEMDDAMNQMRRFEELEQGDQMLMPQPPPGVMEEMPSPAPYVPMQMGGEPMAAAMEAGAMPAEPMPAMAEPMPADLGPAGAEGIASQMDPNVVAVMQGMARNFGDPESAESFEEMMNMVRGVPATEQERREELASVVGPEDAQQTPDSVLALVQPMMLMLGAEEATEVDTGGIGPMAQDAMNVPVSGDMAGGIMQMAAAPPAEGGVPPVNFSEGGEVRRYAEAGVVEGFDVNPAALGPLPMGLSESRFPLQATPELYRSARYIDAAANLPAVSPAPAPAARASTVPDFGPTAAARLAQYKALMGDPGAEEDKDLAQAQFFQDLAKFGFSLMQPGRPGENLLAQAGRAATETGLGQNTLNLIAKQKAAQRAADRGLKLASITATEAEITAAKKAKADLAEASARKKALTPKYVNLIAGGGQKSLGSFDINNPSDEARLRQAQEANPGSYVGRPSKPSGTNFVTVVSEKGQNLGSFDQSSPEGKKQIEESLAKNPGSYVGTPIQPISDRDYFSKTGYSKAEFGKLPKETQEILRGTFTGITDKDFFMKHDMTKEDFKKLTIDEQKRKLGLEVKPDIRKVDDGKTIKFVAVNDLGPDGKPKFIYSSDKKSDPIAPDLYNVTMPDAKGNLVTTVVDAKSAGWVKINERFNDARKRGVPGLSLSKVTRERAPRSYQVEEGDKARIVVSYDNGKTYVDSKGVVRPIPPGSPPVSDTIAAELANAQRVQRQAGAQLRELQDELFGAQVGRDTVISADGTKVLGVYDLSIPDQRAAKEKVLKDNPGATVQPGLQRGDARLLGDLVEQVQEGTGPYAFITGLADNLTGVIPGSVQRSTIIGRFLEKIGNQTQEAKQILGLITRISRAALVTSNRYPVFEVQDATRNFVTGEEVLVNPATMVMKLQNLKRMALFQRISNLERLEAGGLDSKTMSDLRNNTVMLERLSAVLATIPIEGMNAPKGSAQGGVRPATSEDIERARNITGTPVTPEGK